MPTVDELGREELARLAALHSPAELARVQAEVATRRAVDAKGHYDLLAGDSIAAARAAKAALGADDFDRLMDRAKRFHGAAQIAFRAYARARMKADRLRREADKLTRTA